MGLRTMLTSLKVRSGIRLHKGRVVAEVRVASAASVSATTASGMDSEREFVLWVRDDATGMNVKVTCSEGAARAISQNLSYAVGLWTLRDRRRQADESNGGQAGYVGTQGAHGAGTIQGSRHMIHGSNAPVRS